MTARSARDQPRALPDAQPILDGFWKCAQARRCSWARGCPGGRLALQGSMCIHAAPRVCGSDARLARASRTHHLRVPASACLQEPLGFKRALHLVGVILEVAKVGIIHHGLRGPRRGASRAAGSAPPTSGKLYARAKKKFAFAQFPQTHLAAVVPAHSRVLLPSLTFARPALRSIAGLRTSVRSMAAQKVRGAAAAEGNAAGAHIGVRGAYAPFHPLCLSPLVRLTKSLWRDIR